SKSDNEPGGLRVWGPSIGIRPGLRMHRADARSSRALPSDQPILSRGDLDAYDPPGTMRPGLGGRVSDGSAAHQNRLTVERPPSDGLPTADSATCRLRRGERDLDSSAVRP